MVLLLLLRPVALVGVYCVCAHGSLSTGIPGLLRAHQGVKEEDQEEDDEEVGTSNSEGKLFLL